MDNVVNPPNEEVRIHTKEQKNVKGASQQLPYCHGISRSFHSRRQPIKTLRSNFPGHLRKKGDNS